MSMASTLKLWRGGLQPWSYNLKLLRLAPSAFHNQSPSFPTDRTCFTPIRRVHSSQNNREELVRYAKTMSLVSGLLVTVIGGGYIWYRKMSVDASEEEVEPKQDIEVAEMEQPVEEVAKKKRKKPTFREQQIINYEDRIRAYSTPDKIFRMFATIKIYDDKGDWEVFMTPADFVRSITPGVMQPENLGFDQFRNFDQKKFEAWKKSLVVEDSDSLFAKLGTINFTDFIFLLTVISTPKRNFALAFKMFDLNGDGEVDYQEFQKVYKVILHGTAVGSRHRNHATTGNVLGDVSEEFGTYLFGKDRANKLTVEQFQIFHDELTLSVLKEEFNRYEPEDDAITEKDFCELLLSYSDVSDQEKKVYMKRVRKAFNSKQTHPGITFDQLKAFNVFLGSIFEVDVALSMYHAAGASISKDDLKRVSKAVAGVELDDHLIDVVFVIFDENNDNELSHKEFIDIMKGRVSRGLEKPKEMGLGRMVNAVFSCAVAKFKSK